MCVYLIFLKNVNIKKTCMTCMPNMSTSYFENVTFDHVLSLVLTITEKSTSPKSFFQYLFRKYLRYLPFCNFWKAEITRQDFLNPSALSFQSTFLTVKVVLLKTRSSYLRSSANMFS